MQHPTRDHAHTIPATAVELCAAAARLRRYNSGRSCALAALTPAPVLPLECHSGLSKSDAWRDDVRAHGVRTCNTGPLQRGRISYLYEQVRLRHGLPEVRATWGAGIRALRAEPRHVLNGGHA